MNLGDLYLVHVAGPNAGSF